LSISTLETFSQTGFQAALIQKKANIKSYLDTAWTVSAMRGTILVGFLFLSAPFVSEFFNSLHATLIIRVISVSVLFTGFNNIGIIFFQKELEFKRQFYYQLSGTLTNFGVAIALAFLLKNVWALVWGGLAASFVQLILSYFVHPYRPKIRFEKAKFNQLFSFGKWVLGQSIVLFLITQGDDIFVGKMLGVTALGFYQMAYLISNLCATEITHVISGVTFPAYSKMQDDLERMKQACIKVLGLTCFISFPLAAGILVLAPELTLVILTEKWMPMVSALQVMCCFGAMRSIAATFGPVYRAIAKPDIPLKINIIHLSFLCIVIYPMGVKWGILGVAVAISVSMIVALVLTSIKIMSVLRVKFMQLFIPVIISIIASTACGLLVIGAKAFFENVNCYSLSILIGIGVVVYTCLIRIAHRVLGFERTNFYEFITSAD
jgi:O-antigen/teichoic acid export membrane protein